MSILSQLKQRKIFRTAAVYAVVAWAILQIVDVIAAPLNLPDWFATMAIVLLAMGFPIALIFSWIFDLGPQGVTRTTADVGTPLGFRGGFEIALLLLLTVGIGWLIFRDGQPTIRQQGPGNAIPVIMVMDTFAAHGVYDDETRRKSGTNADVLSDILQELPVVIQKEAIGSTWDRESQVLKQHPSLILIHRSAFFHSMNEDLALGYPAQGEPYSDAFQRLYQIADNKLVALLGLVATDDPETRFIVYSRGTGGGWPDQTYRDDWVRQAEGRFPALKGRIITVAVPGGLADGSFRNPDTVATFRELVSSTLGLTTSR